MIFSGSSRFLRTLLMLDLATRENRSKRFICIMLVATGTRGENATALLGPPINEDAGAKAAVVVVTPRTTRATATNEYRAILIVLIILTTLVTLYADGRDAQTYNGL